VLMGKLGIGSGGWRRWGLSDSESVIWDRLERLAISGMDLEKLSIWAYMFLDVPASEARRRLEDARQSEAEALEEVEGE